MCLSLNLSLRPETWNALIARPGSWSLPWSRRDQPTIIIWTQNWGAGGRKLSAPQKFRCPSRRCRNGCRVDKTNKETPDVHDIRKHSHCLTRTFLTGLRVGIWGKREEKETSSTFPKVPSQSPRKQSRLFLPSGEWVWWEAPGVRGLLVHPWEGWHFRLHGAFAQIPFLSRYGFACTQAWGASDQMDQRALQNRPSARQVCHPQPDHVVVLLRLLWGPTAVMRHPETRRFWSEIFWGQWSGGPGSTRPQVGVLSKNSHRRTLEVCVVIKRPQASQMTSEGRAGMQREEHRWSLSSLAKQPSAGTKGPTGAACSVIWQLTLWDHRRTTLLLLFS